MKKIVITILILSLILVSCSNKRLIKKNNPDDKYKKELNYLGENRTGKIFFHNDQSFNAQKISIKNDSLTCINTLISKQLKIPLSDIKKITFKDHIVGLAHGFVFGFGVGATVGLITVDPDGEMAGLGILAGMAAGAVIGGLVGLIFGSNLDYFVE